MVVLQADGDQLADACRRGRRQRGGRARRMVSKYSWTKVGGEMGKTCGSLLQRASPATTGPHLCLLLQRRRTGYAAPRCPAQWHAAQPARRPGRCMPCPAPSAKFHVSRADGRGLLGSSGAGRLNITGHPQTYCSRHVQIKATFITEQTPKRSPGCRLKAAELWAKQGSGRESGSGERRATASRTEHVRWMACRY